MGVTPEEWIAQQAIAKAKPCKVCALPFIGDINRAHFNSGIGARNLMKWIEACHTEVSDLTENKLAWHFSKKECNHDFS